MDNLYTHEEDLQDDEQTEQAPEGAVARRNLLVGTGALGTGGALVGLLSHGPSGLFVGALITAGLIAIEQHGEPADYAWMEKYLSPGARRVISRMRRGTPKDVVDSPRIPYDEYQEYLLSPAWKARAKRIRARDEYQCQDCGRDDVSLDVHHLTYARLGHERDEDLLTLCRACHDARHGNTEEVAQKPVMARSSFQSPRQTGGLVQPQSKRGAFRFSEVLRTFRPTLDTIYLATLPDGKMVFCSAEDLCHVALAGTTRAGKTSIQRMLVAQLCYAGARVLILNPHYSRYILDKKEDWTPFEGRNKQGEPWLLFPPMECRGYDTIAHYLRQIAEEKLHERLERFAHGQEVGRPYFLVLDELPDIVKKIPQAAGYLDDILRQGAKCNIFLIVASQDFLVKTLKMDGGAVRACYRSAFYVGAGGGDATTGRTLLNLPANEIDESLLGRGTVMLRNWQEVPQAHLAYVPLMDNEALYQLLGPSTYTPSQRAEYTDDLVSMAPPTPHDDTPRSTPASYRSGSRTVRPAATRRQEREERLRGVRTVNAPRPAAQKEGSLVERAATAIREGKKTQAAVAFAVGVEVWEIRKNWPAIQAEVERLQDA